MERTGWREGVLIDILYEMGQCPYLLGSVIVIMTTTIRESDESSKVCR